MTEKKAVHVPRGVKLLRTLQGRTLASGGHQTIKLWDVPSGKLLHTLVEGDKSYVLSVAFNPQGCMLASGAYDHTVKLWDVPSGKLLRTLEGHRERIYSTSF